MSTDTFDITKLSRVTILRTLWNYDAPWQAIKDNGVFVKGEMNYEDRNHDKNCDDCKLPLSA